MAELLKIIVMICSIDVDYTNYKNILVSRENCINKYIKCYRHHEKQSKLPHSTINYIEACVSKRGKND